METTPILAWTLRKLDRLIGAAVLGTLGKA